MKKILFPHVASLFTAGTIFMGCQTSSEKIENAEQGVVDAQAKLDQAHKDSAAEYQKMKIEWAGQIANNEKAIADYKTKIAVEKKEAREKDEARLDELEKRNNDMKIKMDEFKENGSETWADFKAGFKMMTDEFDHDITEFGKSIERLTDKK